MSRQDVENGEKTWLEAFNSGDAAGVAACYTKDARMLAPNTDIVQGRADMTGFVQGFVDTGAKLRFDILDVYETPQTCVAVGRYEMTGPERDSGKYIEVWSRQGDGSWLITEDIFNSSLPVPTG